MRSRGTAESRRLWYSLMSFASVARFEVRAQYILRFELSTTSSTLEPTPPISPAWRQRARDRSIKKNLPRTSTHSITSEAPLEVVLIKPGDYWLVENSSGKRIRVTAKDVPREQAREGATFSPTSSRLPPVRAKGWRESEQR